MSRPQENANGFQTTDISSGCPPAAPGIQGPKEEAPSIRLVEATAMEVFFAWEKLRLVFNGLLVTIAVAMMIHKLAFSPLIAILGAYPALLANLGFSLGPIAEGYLCWFGMQRSAARWCVFGLGSLVAAVFTVEAMDEILKHVAADR